MKLTVWPTIAIACALIPGTDLQSGVIRHDRLDTQYTERANLFPSVGLLSSPMMSATSSSAREC